LSLGDALRRSCWAIAVTALALGAIGLLGGVWPAADFLNQFAPAWFCAGLVAVAMLLGVSRAKVAAGLVGAGVAAIGVFMMGPEFAAKASFDAPAVEAQVRIVQFNVFKQNLSPRRTANWVASQKADFVVLEEAYAGGEVMRRLRADFPFVVSCRGRKPCTTVILSRVAPVAGAGLARGDPENRKALSAGWARYDLAGRSITIVAAHLARPWPWGRQEEDRRLLVAELRRLRDLNLILVGDFNTTPWTFAGRRQDKLLGMRRITRALFTWPARVQPRHRVFPAIPFLPIDQAYLRPGLLPVSVRRGPYLGSDHRPVVIDLAWAALRDQRVIE